MDLVDQEKIVFVINSGLYEFIKMFFSFCNSFVIFEWFMESVLVGL